QTIIDHESPAVDANFQVANGGYLGNAVSKPDVESSELVGIIAAIIILIFMFGTLTAMSLPILTALVGVGTGLALIGLLGHGISVPTVGPAALCAPAWARASRGRRGARLWGGSWGSGWASTTRYSSSAATKASWSR